MKLKVKLKPKATNVVVEKQVISKPKVVAPKVAIATPKIEVVEKPSLILEREKEVLTLGKKDTNLDMLLRKAEAIQSNCSDEMVFLKDLSVSPRDIKLFGASKELQFTDHSFGQMCTKLGIPTQYMKKCAQNEETVPLVSENIHRWITQTKGNPQVFLRAHNDNLRGFLSSKYSVMDSPDIIKSLGEVIDLDDYDVKGHLITPERLHIRMTHLDNMKVKGEDLFAGIQIDSSDVGRNTLIIQFFIYKQVCTNGLVLPKLGGEIFRQKHIGIKPDQFVASLKESLDVLPKIVATSEELITTARSRLWTPDDIKEHIVPQIIKDTGLHEEKYTAKIIELVNEKYKRTHWGVVNAITEVAQDFTLDTRLELEKYAGKWLA